MGRIVVTEFISLDGVVQALRGELADTYKRCAEVRRLEHAHRPRVEQQVRALRGSGRGGDPAEEGGGWGHLGRWHDHGIRSASATQGHMFNT